MLNASSKGGHNENEKIVISLDAMGGDNAPDAVIGGASLIAQDKKNFPGIFLKIYGNKNKIEQLIQNCPSLLNRSELIHCDQAIPADENVAAAIRNYKKFKHVTCYSQC